MKKVLLIIIVISLIASIINWKNICKIFYKIEYSEYVEKYAEEHNVSPYLIYSIIREESKFNISAMSNKGALGLMQIMDKTAKEIAENKTIEYESGTTLYNPEKNIQIGVIYFASLLEQFNDVNLALAAYNAGKGNVQKWIEQGIIKEDGSDIENIPFKETNMYVRKIQKNYKMYKLLYE